MPFTVRRSAKAPLPTHADILAMIHSIQGRHTLSFQFIERGGDPQHGFAAIERLHQTHGEWLAGIGGDLYWFNAPASVPAEPTFVRDYAIPYIEAGGLATLCCSMPNPFTGGGLHDPTIGADGGRDIITPGTPTYDAFRDLLRQLGDCIAPAAAADAPLICRFYHEIQGPWFWWGCLEDGIMAEVWRQTRDYLVNTRGFQNLLFCFCANSGVSSTLPLHDARYPGDDYVDLLGLDGYTSDPHGLQGDVRELVGRFPGKPIWLSEFGSGSPSGGDLAFRQPTLIDAHKTAFPEVFGFQQWWSANAAGPGWGIELMQDQAAFFADPYVLFRDDLVFEPPVAPTQGTLVFSGVLIVQAL
jgi:mannan endo-1,4-beta-mannosidase